MFDRLIKINIKEFFVGLKRTDEGRPPTVPSLLSRNYVDHVVSNEL